MDSPLHLHNTPTMHPLHVRAQRLLLGLGAAIGLTACQGLPGTTPTSQPPTSPAVVGEIRPGSGVLHGYLSPAQLPDSLALLPPPPTKGSAQEAADLAQHRQTRALRGSPRWALAVRDAEYRSPKAVEAFSCVLDMPISEQETPHLHMLMRRTLTDAGLATYKAKDNYKRQRPFVIEGASTCTPQEEAFLAKDGSYPSGHAALGWAWALVLTELAPTKADALLQRGYAFGQSRVVCGVHWPSDVDAGRLMGTAAVARLQADPTFRSQMALARAEIEDARAKNLHSPRSDCAEEARALAP